MIFPLPAPEHCPPERLTGEPRCGEIHRDHRVPIRAREVLRRMPRRDPRCIDEDIHRTLLLLDAFCECRDAVVSLRSYGTEVNVCPHASTAARVPVLSAPRCTATISAPARASPTAIAAPIPRLAPVTTARCPRNRNGASRSDASVTPRVSSVIVRLLSLMLLIFCYVLNTAIVARIARL